MRNLELDKFVELMPSVKDAHEYLDCSYEQLYKMRRCKRGLGTKYAKLIIDKFPNLSLVKLLFPEDHQDEAAA